MSRSRLTSVALSALALGAVFACADTAGVLAPAGEPSLNSTGFLSRYVTVCKIGPAGTTATFSISATGGTLLLGSSVTLNATSLDDTSECREVWASAEGQGTEVTISETARSAGTELEKIVWVAGDVWYEAFPPTSSITVDAVNGALVWFKNKAVDRVGGQGCTPGYWKNHLNVWWPTGYTTADNFDAVFGVDLWNPDITLREAINTGGGGKRKLTRHATAALLNASHPLVAYDLTPAQVISMVQSAAASGNFDATGDILAGYNEQNTAGFCD